MSSIVTRERGDDLKDKNGFQTTEIGPQRGENPKIEAAKRDRELLRAKLESENADDLIAALSKCGVALPLVCTACGHIHIAETRCKKRWCPVCARTIAAKKAARYRKAIDNMQSPIMTAYTCENWDSTSRNFYREIFAGHKKFRSLAWYRKKVRGGIFGVEVTNKGNGWHAHGHAVIDTNWFSVTTLPPDRFASLKTKKRRYKLTTEELSEQWSLCIDRPGSVFVRRVYTREGESQGDAVEEAVKYAITPESLLGVECASDCIRLMTGTRTCVAFGNCHGKTGVDEEEYEGTECSVCHTKGTTMPEEFAIRGM